jgi:hypothetical protein
MLTHLPADTVYVATSGKDTWPGTSTRPLLSISRAVEFARVHQIHRIVIGGGEYPQTHSISFDERDSGLTIEAKRGTRPLITGAILVPAKAINRATDAGLQKRVTDLDKNGRAWTINVDLLPGAKLAPFTPYGFSRPIVPGPTELFADNVPMTIARWPNKGFTTIKSVQEAGNGENDRDQPARMPIFTGIEDRAKGWKSIENAWLYGYWKFDWADETIKLHSVDPKTGEITLETPHTFGVGADSPYFVENLPDELDAVGEYFVDIVGKRVRFVTENSKAAAYRLSVLGEPLVVATKASTLHIRGIDFAYTRGDGADLESCTGTAFEGCRFFNLGERAVVVSNGQDSGVRGCDIWNTGEGGVVLNGGDRNTLSPANLFVENCDIHDYQRRSQTYRPGVSISGVGNRVSHCSIHDAPHSAIIFGGNDHNIVSNEFFRTLTRTGDGGVVYTGRDWTARGTVINDNYFHDNIGLGKWEPAIYFDDLASGLTAVGNLIVRCHWGFLIGGGQDNLIAENEIVDCKLGMHCDARGLGWAAKSKPTMMERLNAVPYTGKIWTKKYPNLARILNADPMVPRANTIMHNTLVRSGKLKVDTEVAFDKAALWVNNVETQTGPEPLSVGQYGLIQDAIRRTLPRTPKK